MNRCLITYDEIPAGDHYAPRGLKLLARRLTRLETLPWSAEEQRQEAATRAWKMSIQGVQPKLSARLDVAHGMFHLVDTGGEYILKPQGSYAEVPENEDLTMKLAGLAGIETPVHGLLASRDGTRTYFIRRFDRAGKARRAVEDFAQLSGQTRETKYDSSMERVARVLEAHCTFPLVEKVKLFRLVLFSFLAGNEDMHLKNFSLIRNGDTIALSPAYDLVNTTIAVGNAQEELALPVDGKKRNLSRSILVEYYGQERLGLPPRVIDDVLNGLRSATQEWTALIRMSFLSDTAKTAYENLVASRSTRLFSQS